MDTSLLVRLKIDPSPALLSATAQCLRLRRWEREGSRVDLLRELKRHTGRESSALSQMLVTGNHSD